MDPLQIFLLILIAALFAADAVYTRRMTRRMEEANRLTRAVLEQMGYREDPDISGEKYDDRRRT